MNHVLIAKGLLTSLFVFASTFASAEYTAVAQSTTTTNIYSGQGVNQKIADQAAMALCQSKHPTCEIKVTVAIAFANSQEPKGPNGVARSFISEDDAKKRAIEACGNDKCKITDVFTAPGLYAIAEAFDKKNNGIGYYTIDRGFKIGDVSDEALQACKKMFKGARCQILWLGSLPGDLVREPVASNKPTISSPQVKSCRPNSEILRCTSRCTNGNCELTYENGCKMRVQVNAKFNPFTNKWEYPNPDC